MCIITCINGQSSSYQCPSDRGITVTHVETPEQAAREHKPPTRSENLYIQIK